MNDFVQSSAMFGVFISLMAYEIGVLLQKKTKKPVLLCSPKKPVPYVNSWHQSQKKWLLSLKVR